MPSEFTNIRNCLGYIKDELLDIYPVNEALRIAYLLLEDTLSQKRNELLANLDKKIDLSLSDKIIEAVAEIKKEKPIQYVLGKSEFYDCTILLTPGVLIPRPETEELVNWIVKDIAGKNVSIMDIGTGSGCIAISLANILGSASIFATDSSKLALDMARKSAQLNEAEVSFIHHDILLPCSSDDLPVVNIIVSNPPYVLDCEKREMKKNVLDFEPHEALFVPDNDPLLFYRSILELAKTKLSQNDGLIYFEINERMGDKIKDLLEDYNFNDIEIRRDLHGKDRMVKARFTLGKSGS